MHLPQLAARFFNHQLKDPKPAHMTESAGSMITFIDNRNFTTEIDKAEKPVLLLCMPKGPDFSSQFILLHQIAEKYKDNLKVCLLEEELINGFRQMRHIKGTPVYLLFFQGKEKGRMLGMAGEEQLTSFLFRLLSNTGREPEEGSSWE